MAPSAGSVEAEKPQAEGTDSLRGRREQGGRVSGLRAEVVGDFAQHFQGELAASEQGQEEDWEERKWGQFCCQVFRRRKYD